MPPPKRILTKPERDGVLAILAIGSSRTAAARYAKCDPRTLRREIADNPEFAEQVAKAEEDFEVFYLSRIRSAAQKDQHWRAAAWALERLLPKRYAPQKPAALLPEQVQKFMTNFVRILAEEVPEEEQRERILNRISEEIAP